MGLTYEAVLWNRQKKIYDRVLWLGIVLVLATFSVAEGVLHPEITAETLIIRSTAFTAVLLLHVILLIGPLSRLDRRFLPLLFNRRHMGVSMFLLVLIHGVICVIQFHTLGDVNPLVSLFLSNQRYQEISAFPFQILGFFAWIIFLLMAVSSHDFWLKNLGPKFWKAMHMLVYVAYGLVMLHVALGTLQYEDDPFYKVLLFGGFALIVTLHIVAGIRENQRLAAERNALEDGGYYAVAAIDEIESDCGKSVFVNGQNIAVFKYDGKVSAVHNVCKHQMGPLGEGKVVDGCITCPWHGYQYLPGNGQSPPPFKETLATYRVKVLDGKIWVNPEPLEEGTAVEPALIPS